MSIFTPEFQQGKQIIANLIGKAYVYDKGFYHFYEWSTLERKGGLNDNDFGDYFPCLHYFGHINVALNYLQALISRYELFFDQKGKRFGSTRLSRLGIIDLFSNSDFYQGILFARQHQEYKQFHREIDRQIEKLIRITTNTRYSHF